MKKATTKALPWGVLIILFTLGSASRATAQSWIQLLPSGGPPLPREGHSAVYDPANHRMIVFGGSVGGPSLNDLWVLTDANGLGGAAGWIQLFSAGTGPSGRDGHRAVYDQKNNIMIIFGGRSCSLSSCTYLNEVWTLSNANGLTGTPTWTQLVPTGGPPQIRWDTAMVYDPTTNRIIIQAGQDCSSPGCSFPNDVWMLTNANGMAGTPAWFQSFPSGGPPINRVLHTGVYDPASNRLTIFGGSPFGLGVLTDTWVLTDANGIGSTPTWTQLAPSGGPPSHGFWASATYDASSNRMTVFGGASSSGKTNEAWVLTGANGIGAPAWTLLAPTGGPPAVRYGHTAVYDPTNNRMTVFGGRGGGDLNDVWVLTSANGILNNPPVAICKNFTVSAGAGCTANASIDNGSFDPDSGDAITITQSPAGPYPIGTTSVTLTVTDNHGASSQCTGTVTVLAPQLAALGPANVWLGLKNSDDVGTKFDLLAEVFKNGSPVASEQLNSVPGGSSGFNNAVLRTINLALPAPVDACSGDTLSIRLSVRIAVGVSGHRSGTARLWFNDAQANSRIGTTINGVPSDYFLLSGFTLGAAAGPGPKKTIDVFVDRLVGGNPFKPFGTWSKTF